MKFVQLTCHEWYTLPSISRIVVVVREYFIQFFCDYRWTTTARMFTTGYWNERCLSYLIGYIAIRLEFWYGCAACWFDSSLLQKPCNWYFKQILWYDRRSRNIEDPNSWLLALLKEEGIVIVIEAIRFL